MPDWTVKYGCKQWKGQDEFSSEAAARAWYQTYCEEPPKRGGVHAKYVSLHNDKGEYVDGFATGGSYGKVQSQ